MDGLVDRKQAHRNLTLSVFPRGAMVLSLIIQVSLQTITAVNNENQLHVVTLAKIHCFMMITRQARLGSKTLPCFLPAMTPWVVTPPWQASVSSQEDENGHLGCPSLFALSWGACHFLGEAGPLWRAVPDDSGRSLPVSETGWPLCDSNWREPLLGPLWWGRRWSLHTTVESIPFFMAASL